jgi:RHS repeat-associated protein
MAYFPNIGQVLNLCLVSLYRIIRADELWCYYSFSNFKMTKKITSAGLILLFLFPTGLFAQTSTDDLTPASNEVVQQDSPDTEDESTTVRDVSEDSTPPESEIAPKTSEEEEEIPEELSLNLLSSNDVVENPNAIKSIFPDVDILTGALIYKYPIVLPPGRNKLTPDLSLIYNSGNTQNNSPFGYGWSVSIPYIERINRKGSDKLYASSTFVSSLSGELVFDSGTTYKARVEEGSFVNYSYASNKWLATDKEGTKYYFGSTTQSRQYASSSSNIAKWMIEEIRDTNNNFIRFEYVKTGNQVYPSKIFYTGNGSTDGIFEVNFNYATRTDQVVSYSPAFITQTSKRLENIQIKVNGVTAKEYQLTYKSGNNTKRSLLASIATASSSLALPATEFNYQVASSATTFDPSTYQLPSLYRSGDHDYYFMALGDQARFVDINGDGLEDFIYTPASYFNASSTITTNTDSAPRVYLNTGNGWTFNPSYYQIPSYYHAAGTNYFFPQFDDHNQLVDVNGDGLPDVIHTENYFDSDGIIPDNAEHAPRVYLNTGTGWTFSSSTYQLPTFYHTSGSDRAFSELNSQNQLIDVNGDGLPDFVYTDDYADADGIIPNDVDFAPRVYLNTGNGWSFNPSIYQLPSLDRPVPGDHMFFKLSAKVRLIDVNGDNLPDFVYTETVLDDDGIISDNNYGGNPRVYLNTGSGWAFSSSTYQLPSYFHTPSSKYYFMELGLRSQLMDVNGDGLPDFVYTENFSDNDGIIDNNIDNAPRVYLNNGNGWEFEPNQYQLPSFYRSSNSDYYFMALDLNRQFVDVNGDSLPDFVYTASMGDSDGIIGDNIDPAPRAYINTGTGWTFSSSTYQLPTFYHPSFTQPYFMLLDNQNKLIDVNNDGLADFVDTQDVSDDDGVIPNNVENKPRVYLNKGKASDYLSRVTLSEGGSLAFNYQVKSIGGPNSNSPYYPQSLYVVKDIVGQDGLGSIATTSYAYYDGQYYYHPDPFKQFAGFARVEKIDPVGNVTKTYFHQGNTTASSTGEYADNIAKAGKAYRVEQYDSNGNLFAKTINYWDRANLGNGASYVKLAQTLQFNYDGDSDHKEKAESYTFNDAKGMLSQKTEWGTVSGNDDGTFSDIGSDKFTSTITYATSSSGLILLPSDETVFDQSGSKIRETRRYYDNQSLGAVTLGNETKTEQWQAASSYVDTEKTYNSYGLISQTKDPRDKATNYTYDSYNLFVATSTNPLSQSTAMRYDYTSGKPIEIKDPNGYKFQTILDAFGRVLQEKQPDLATPATLVTKTSYAYVDNVFPRSLYRFDYLTSGTSTASYRYFDGFGRPVQERTEAQGVNNFVVKDTSYHPLGKVLRESLPYFSTGASSTSATTTPALFISYQYDALNRLTALANAVGTTTTNYDDWKQTLTDPEGKTKALYFDAYDNLEKVDEVNSTSTYTTQYEWNGNKNLTKITDAENNIRNFTYDGLGRRLTAEDLHGASDTTFGTWYYAYDESGNLASTTDPRSQNVVYTYDNLNRPLTENFTGSSGTEARYGYDSCVGGIGKLCTASTTDAVQIDYEYNPLGLIKRELKTIKGIGFWTDYGYDRQKNQLSIIHNDVSTIGYDYNSAGQVTGVWWQETGGPVTLLSAILYSPHGQIAYMESGSGASTTNTYNANALYRLTNKLTKRNATKFQDLSYTYSPAGDITELVDNSDTLTKKSLAFSYDDLHRLTVASSTGAVASTTNYRQTYAYSPTGNITYKSDQGSYAYAGTGYANPQAATGVGTTSFSYDRAGNVATTSSWTYYYDYQNRLATSTNGISTTTYTYLPSRLGAEANDRVTQKDAISTVYTYYISPGYETVTEGVVYTPAESITKHVYLGDLLIADIVTNSPLLSRGGGGPTQDVHYMNDDHLNGPTTVVDDTGFVEETLDYYPYGSLRLKEQIAYETPHKYTGHVYDEGTGLNYMNSRYQNGSIGRFIGQDPKFIDISFDLADPQKLNAYSYARNNPINYVDRDGKEPIKALVGTIDTFVGVMNNSTNKVGQYSGSDAKNYLVGAGGTTWSWNQLRPLPNETYYNNKEGRYVYTESGGWIDMSHFIFYAGKALGYKDRGSDNPVERALQAGYWQEFTDKYASPHSAYSYEDLPSDWYGADFATNHFDPDSKMTLGEQLGKYFKGVLKASDPKNAPNYDKLPDRDNRNKPTYTNRTAKPQFTK